MFGSDDVKSACSDMSPLRAGAVQLKLKVVMK